MLGVVVLTPLLSACGGGHYLMKRLERNEGDGWIDMGDSCGLVQRGGPSSGSELVPNRSDGANKFGMKSVSSGGKVTVTMTTASDELVREYDMKFVRSGDEDIMEITTDAGTTYRATLWGSPSCDVRTEEERAGGGASSD